MTRPEDSRWAFVFAHPGHELRAFHRLELCRPSVSLLTDGSGGTGRSRVAATQALVERLGASRGPFFGAMTDADAYTHIMAGRAEPFVELGHALADHFVRDGVTAVLADAAEGYNPAHDLCHGLARAAVARARARVPSLRLYDVPMVGTPAGRGRGEWLHLDDAAFARKLQAALEYRALADETAAALEAHGPDAFRVEFARDAERAIPLPDDFTPYYEQVGEARVRTGQYQAVIRYREHLAPLIAALTEVAATA